MSSLAGVEFAKLNSWSKPFNCCTVAASPFCRGAQTLPALEKLVQYDLLEPADAKALADAYPFLRDVEHRLQMDENRQTHTIPR